MSETTPDPRPRARSKRRHARCVALATLVLAGAEAWLGVPVVHAAQSVPEDAESLVLIRKLTGPNAEELQVTVEAAVAEYFSAVSASDAEEQELAEGEAAMVQMSREKKYRAYVTGNVRIGSGGRTLLLTVYSGDTGKAVGNARFPGLNMRVLSSKVDAQAGKVLAKLLRKTEAAPPEKGKEDEDGKEVVKLEVELEEEPAPPEPAEEAADGPAPSPFDVNLAVGFMNLGLTYNQPVQDSLGFALLERPSTPLAIRAGANLYPGAFFGSDALADIGLSVRYYTGLGGSITVNGAPFDLSFRELNLGLRGRIRLDDVELGGVLGWGTTSAVVEGDNETYVNAPTLGTDPGLFPDVKYDYFRFGVDGRAVISGPWSLAGALSIRLPSIGDGAGEMREVRWFPRASATGVDAELGILHELLPGLSATAGLDVRMYGLTMHSNTGDPGTSSVAGGADDRYLGGFVGVEYRH